MKNARSSALPLRPYLHWQRVSDSSEEKERTKGAWRRDARCLHMISRSECFVWGREVKQLSRGKKWKWSMMLVAAAGEERGGELEKNVLVLQC